MRIKKGDKVLVITGKDKGVQGEVIQVAPPGVTRRGIPGTGRILVEGVNLIKKHIPAEKTKKGGKIGQRIELPAFINVSNAKLICPNCGKAVRVGYVVNDKGEKKRMCKKCKQVVENKGK